MRPLWKENSRRFQADRLGRQAGNSGGREGIGDNPRFLGHLVSALPGLVAASGTDVYAKLKGDGLKVYAVNVAEDKPAVQAFVEQTKLALRSCLTQTEACRRNSRPMRFPRRF